jgi:phosphohistidine swiveling domain-containing protein
VIRSVIEGTGQNIPQIFEKNNEARRKSEADTYGRAGHLGPNALERFKKILEWAQFWVPVLDDRTWSLVSQYSLFDLIWETGVRLQREGVTDQPEDTLILFPEDLEQIARGQTIDVSQLLYIQRKFEYEKYKRLTPPAFIGQPPISIPEDESEQETETMPAVKNEDVPIIEGRGIAPGRTKGFARCVHNLLNPAVLSTFQNHHVLVCTGGGIGRNTDWLSLLMVVKGLVTSSNGPHLHHAAQIARECGVPYVQVSPDNIGLISDDQAIEIDGHSGMVTTGNTHPSTSFTSRTYGLQGCDMRQ